ncbi:MAG: hypothetical protein M1827_005484 [Pycnora praestabilis]|nr:MAG: hypothetical protein M1827_005484 [Pycnora praestabilis]
MLSGYQSPKPSAQSRPASGPQSQSHKPNQAYGRPSAQNRPHSGSQSRSPYQQDHYRDRPPPSQNQYPQAHTGSYGRSSGSYNGGPQGYDSASGETRYNSNNSISSYGQSPPQSNYGFGHPPLEYHNRPPTMSRPPPTPAPGATAGTDLALFPLFKAVDREGNGQLTEAELRSALVNGDFTSFDPYTVKMMIRMFDTDRSGTIGFDEFCGLWSFLADWRTLFDRFDEDGSGNISYDEFTTALRSFGYKLTPSFVNLLFKTYDKRGDNAISFDLFVQSCISLKRMTDVFKKYDDDRDGYISLSL